MKWSYLRSVEVTDTISAYKNELYTAIWKNGEIVSMLVDKHDLLRNFIESTYIVALYFWVQILKELLGFFAVHLCFFAWQTLFNRKM